MAMAGNCSSCNITAGEVMELFEVKFSFLAEIGNVGGEEPQKPFKLLD